MKMKAAITFTLFAGILNLALASIRVSRFGGCLNQTAIDPKLAFHCHFDSSACYEDEIWLDSIETEDQGYGPCTCDDDYNNNVYSYACYDIKTTHAVECAASKDQCPEGWYQMGDRYNNNHDVDEECGHGDAAFDGGDDTSCGKRCTCNFQYQSRDSKVTIGSTEYGMCYDASARTKYCAVHSGTCAEGEVFYNPHSSSMQAEDCTCENVHIGGCADGSTFSHCGVSADSCQQGQTYLAPRALREANVDVDCRLCHDSWSEGTKPLESSEEAILSVSSDINTAAKSSDDTTKKSSDDKSSDDKSSDDKSSDDKSSDDVARIRSSDTVMISYAIQIPFTFLVALFLY